MTNPDQSPAAPPTGPTPPAAPANPPWGDPANFDPAKAWSLIENLRGDKTSRDARIAELEPLAAKAREQEEAQKSEVQKALDRAATAEKSATDSAAETLRLRTALTHGISDADAALFLTATTAEGLTAQATALAAKNAGQPVPPPPPTVPSTGQRTPVEALVPGALPTPPQPSLDELIATAQAAGDVRKVISLQNQKLAKK